MPGNIPGFEPWDPPALPGFKNIIPPGYPDPPNIPDRINYVIDHWSDPCDGPWTIYFQCAFPALLEAIIIWYTADLKNILTAYVRPSKALGRSRSQRKGRGKGRKGRRGGFLRRFFARLLGFDPNEFIGKHLPGAEDLRGRKITNGLWFLWMAEGVYERLAFYYMVADVSTLFFYRWTSLLYQTRYCLMSRYGICLATGNEQLVGNVVEWNGVNLPNIEKQRGDIVWAGVSGAVPEGPYSVTCSLELRDVYSSDTTLTIGVFSTAHSITEPVSTHTVTVPAGERAPVPLQADIRGPTAVSIRCQVNRPLAVIKDGMICIVGRRTAPDPLA